MGYWQEDVRCDDSGDLDQVERGKSKQGAGTSGNGSGESLEVLAMVKRKRSRIRELRTQEALVRKFNVLKMGRPWVMTKFRMYP